MSLRRFLTSPAAWVAPILLVFLVVAWQDDSAAQKEARKKKKATPSLPVTEPFAELDHPDRQEDFPVEAIGSRRKWVQALNEEAWPV